MRKRRGTAREASDLRKQMSIFEPGDVVTSVLAGSIDFIGSITRIDKKVAKVFVNWGDGIEAQCDPDEIQLIPHMAGVADRFSRLARRGRLSEDIPGGGDQFVGDPKTHGIDKPRGGGFSIMQNLQKDLAPESREEAKDGPFVASESDGRRMRASAMVEAVVGTSDEDASLMMASRRGRMGDKQNSDFSAGRIARKPEEGDEIRFRGPDGLTTVDEIFDVYSDKVDTDKTESTFRQRDLKWKGRYWQASEGRQGSDFSRKAEVVSTANLYREFRREGNNPKEAAHRILDILTNGAWAAMDGDKIRRAVSKFIREFEPMYRKFASEGPTSRRALYWGGPGRKYRQTKNEQEEGACSCPKCKGEMEAQPFTKSEKLHSCGGCGFKVPSGSLTTKKIEIEIEPSGEVEIEVTAGRRGRL